MSTDVTPEDALRWMYDNRRSMISENDARAILEVFGLDPDRVEHIQEPHEDLDDAREDDAPGVGINDLSYELAKAVGTTPYRSSRIEGKASAAATVEANVRRIRDRLDDWDPERGCSY